MAIFCDDPLLLSLTKKTFAAECVQKLLGKYINKMFFSARLSNAKQKKKKGKKVPQKKVFILIAFFSKLTNKVNVESESWQP